MISSNAYDRGDQYGNPDNKILAGIMSDSFPISADKTGDARRCRNSIVNHGYNLGTIYLVSLVSLESSHCSPASEVDYID